LYYMRAFSGINQVFSQIICQFSLHLYYILILTSEPIAYLLTQSVMKLHVPSLMWLDNKPKKKIVFVISSWIISSKHNLIFDSV
jgi:hypothetical protein